MKKFVYYSIIIFIWLVSGCVPNNTGITKEEEPIIKYYRQALAYNDKWFAYKVPPYYFDEAPVNFDFKDAVSRCGNPWTEISKVYYKNQEAYTQKRPYQVIYYCLDPVIPSSIEKYDDEGKIKEIQLKNSIITYAYTESEKIETTFYKDKQETSIMRFVYDKNKKLQHIYSTKANGEKTIYKFNKEKTDLYEYDMKGRRLPT